MYPEVNLQQSHFVSHRPHMKSLAWECIAGTSQIVTVCSVAILTLNNFCSLTYESGFFVRLLVDPQVEVGATMCGE
jgi:hypothetical protein